MLVFMFVALMVIPLIMIFRNIFGFEEKAQAMTDALKTAETFKRDYLLALYAPVNNITVCHWLPRLEPCPVSMRSPQVFRVPSDAQNKYAPVFYVSVADPPWNASVFLDLMAYGRASGELDVVEPRINSSNCWNETIESINYGYCSFNCTSPIKISKIRHYVAGIGRAGGAVIDNISVEQGAEGC